MDQYNNQQMPQGSYYQEMAAYPSQSVNDPSIVKLHIDPTEVFSEVEHRLRGEVKVKDFDKDGNIKTYWKKVRSPYLNEDGIGRVLSILSGYLVKTQTLSYFSEKQINNKMLALCKELRIALIRNWELWGIEPKDVRVVKMMVEVLADANLRRALEGGERRSLSKETQVRQELSNPQQNNNGLFGGLFGRNK